MSGAGAMISAGLAARCEYCRHRLDDRRKLEQRIGGLASFGSAYGASIGESRLCGLHDRWVSPGDACASFAEAQGAGSSASLA
ncbi:hypothetical protein ACXU4B_00215 [Dyella soli]|uniref:Uncharacterized protein n=1 Tax=Dyella soli TaxID=522319 RepID=A0A4R0YNT3_9GAMM|nr:hypothetical protein [Dyella soli]TCI09505.1 hypothetical protein EZM97_11080 [Dyella soli]